MAVGVSVDSNDVSGDVALAGGSDEHFLGSGFNVLPGALLVDEHSGSLDHKVDPHIPAFSAPVSAKQLKIDSGSMGR